jgi:hypothetical protein
MVPRRTILLAATAACVFAGTAHGQTQSLRTPASATTFAPVCNSGYYKNASGKCVHSPSSTPAGATAKCRDGTYSYSQHASGTCSYHGGVAVWIHHP